MAKAKTAEQVFQEFEAALTQRAKNVVEGIAFPNEHAYVAGFLLSTLEGYAKNNRNFKKYLERLTCAIEELE